MWVEEGILELSSKDVKKIDEEVAGIQPKTDPMLGTYQNFKDGQERQLCQFYNTWLVEDICLEIVSHLFKLL